MNADCGLGASGTEGLVDTSGPKHVPHECVGVLELFVGVPWCLVQGPLSAAKGSFKHHHPSRKKLRHGSAGYVACYQHITNWIKHFNPLSTKWDKCMVSCSHVGWRGQTLPWPTWVPSPSTWTYPLSAGTRRAIRWEHLRQPRLGPRSDTCLTMLGLRQTIWGNREPAKHTHDTHHDASKLLKSGFMSRTPFAHLETWSIFNAVKRPIFDKSQ